MSDKLRQFFCLVSNYRKETDPIKQKIIIEQGMSALSRTTGSARLRIQIDKFIKENTSAQQTG